MVVRGSVHSHSKVLDERNRLLVSSLVSRLVCLQYICGMQYVVNPRPFSVFRHLRQWGGGVPQGQKSVLFFSFF